MEERAIWGRDKERSRLKEEPGQRSEARRLVWPQGGRQTVVDSGQRDGEGRWGSAALDLVRKTDL